MDDMGCFILPELADQEDAIGDLLGWRMAEDWQTQKLVLPI